MSQESMWKWLLCCCLMVPLKTPLVALLSVFMGVAGWGCPNSSSVALTGAASWAFTNRAPTSASAADATVNMLSGLNATRHPVHKAAKPAPASQTNSAREHSVCAIKPLKSIRGSPTRLSHHRDHRDNTRRITRLGKKPFPPE